MRSFMCLCLPLLLQSVALAQNLDAHISQLNKRKSACSACNLVSRTLDAESFSDQLVMSWKEATNEERSKQLKKSLRRSCKRLADMEIARSDSALNASTFIDVLDLRKTGFGDKGFEDAKKGPEINKLVQDLCELIVSERAAELVQKMDAWRLAAQQPRRVVDLRFNSDLRLCSGGVLSVCEDVFQESRVNQPTMTTPGGGDDDDDDDDDGGGRRKAKQTTTTTTAKQKAQRKTKASKQKRRDEL